MSEQHNEPEKADTNENKNLSLWRRLRNNYWGSLAFDIAVIAFIAIAVNLYQNRNLPGSPEHAPELNLMTLDGSPLNLKSLKGKKTVVYFFAPWCHICHASIGNLEDMWQDNKEDVNAIVVALDYKSIDEVREFIADKNLTMPILLGHSKTSSDWNVFAFPTYYVIAEDGHIIWRSVGYSTELGLRIRT